MERREVIKVCKDIRPRYNLVLEEVKDNKKESKFKEIS